MARHLVWLMEMGDYRRQQSGKYELGARRANYEMIWQLPSACQSL